MVHDDYKEMLPAQALSSLDAEDARALNQHLSECEECRIELAEWENTAAELALGANPVEPSSHVRARIMHAIRSEKQAQPASRVVPFPQSRRDLWTSFGPIGAIAAAVLFLALIIWILVLVQQNRALHRENQSLASEMQFMQQEFGRSEDFVEILTLPGAKVASLSGSGPSLDARAKLVYSRGGEVMLLASGLPQNPAGKEYQLWFIVGNNPPIPGKTFVPDNAGRGALRDVVSEQPLDSAVFAVTLEPAGGVDAPTGAIYLRSGQ